MITPERVYEVFGISPAPWKLDQIKGYCIDNILDQNDGVIITCDVPSVSKHDNSFLIKSSPEMLAALVNSAIELDSRFCFTGSHGTMQTSYNLITKAIESADSKNRKWDELKKELII